MVAVTGFTGFIGRRLVAKIPSQSVLLLGRRPPASAARAWLHFDLSGSCPALPQGLRTVIHLAADLECRLAAEQELGTIRNLLSASQQVGASFVFVSSQSAANPQGEYGRRKALAESIVRSYGGSIVRPGLVVGGRQVRPPAATLTKLCRWPLLPDFGPSARVQVIHVDDLVEVLLRVSQLECAKTFEVAGQAVPMRELLSELSFSKYGRVPHFVAVPAWLTRVVSMSGERGLRASLRQMMELVPMPDDLPALGLTRRTLRSAVSASVNPALRDLLVECSVLFHEQGLPRPKVSHLKAYAGLVSAARGVSMPARQHAERRAEYGREPGMRSWDAEMRRARRRLAVSIFELSPAGALHVMKFGQRDTCVSWYRLIVSLARIAIELGKSWILRRPLPRV